MSLKDGVAIVLLLSAAQFAVMSTSATAQTLRREPAMGAMREGERVLVDDGTCPKGKIKEVIGGNHVKVGGTKQIERRRRCIAR
jgi:hypothetical protein